MEMEVSMSALQISTPQKPKKNCQRKKMEYLPWFEVFVNLYYFSLYFYIETIAFDEQARLIDEIIDKNEKSVLRTKKTNRERMKKESHINNKKKKDEISNYLCLCAFQKKETLFVDILQKYHQQIIWNRNFIFVFWFFFLGKKKYLLSHLVRAYHHDVKWIRYVLEAEVIRQDEYKEVFEDALSTAIECENLRARNVLLQYLTSGSIKNKQEKDMREYGQTQMQERNKCEVMLEYMKAQTTSMELSITMNSLFKTMTKVIKDGKPISVDMLNLCWLHDPQNTMWSEVWFQKCKDILQSVHLYKNIHDYKWMDEYFIFNPSLLLWPEQQQQKQMESKSNTENENKNERKEWGGLDDIKDICEMQIEKINQELEKQMDLEKTKFAKEYQQLQSFEWNAENKEYIQFWKQDEDEFGLHSYIPKSELYYMAMDSEDVTFHPKHIYDVDVYLNRLLIRAHHMNEFFQLEMKNIFKDCLGCTFEQGDIPTCLKCKNKVSTRFPHGHVSDYLTSACLVDILRCRVVFVDITHLLQGLKYWMEVIQSKHNRNIFQIVRLKNGFANDSNHKHKCKHRRTSNSIKVNLLVTKDNESIVTEVQFVLQFAKDLQQLQLPFLRILQRTSFLDNYLRPNIMQQFSFDFQLQVVSWHPPLIADLMLFFPNQFRSVLFSQSSSSSSSLLNASDERANFVMQMAKNSQLSFGFVKNMLQTGHLIPLDVVQQQLMQTDSTGTYPLMSALVKQSDIQSIKLFVPSDPDHARIVWHAITDDQLSTIAFGVRNTKVPLSSILQLLKENIRDQNRWEYFIRMQETRAGFTPLMDTVCDQSQLFEDDVRMLLPQDFQQNVSFWEVKDTGVTFVPCSVFFFFFFFGHIYDGATLLHILCEKSFPNVLSRLKVLQAFMPQDCWQRLLLTTDQVCCVCPYAHFYVYMHTLVCFLPEKLDGRKYHATIDPKVSRYFILENDHQCLFYFVRLFASYCQLCLSLCSYGQDEHNIEGLNMLHLSLSNSKYNEFDNLLCLRSKMPETIWNELLDEPDRSLVTVCVCFF
ncbi:hypothetical protein RFI_15807 [Reticulomyxa filosa]|uniref:Uncharacterized protein n=1 Tax=Reticulomyxa filosa TaxID=46433 RepID=X6N7Y4_RETFI|nr:hypothetical protein RFI_15807 [Reticulomyxa filosa]|eukprot:ETO21397.1 hypothetical protein RFI_15807 [Reticulomyxa filosa]